MIAIGSDHGGYRLKQSVIRYLEEKKISYEDLGCYSYESCDYPEFGRAVANAVAEGRCGKGIVICTTGIGISMTANKVPAHGAADTGSKLLSHKSTFIQNNSLIYPQVCRNFVIDNSVKFALLQMQPASPFLQHTLRL